MRFSYPLMILLFISINSILRMIYMYIASLLIIAHMHLQSQASFYNFKLNVILFSR